MGAFIVLGVVWVAVTVIVVWKAGHKNAGRLSRTLSTILFVAFMAWMLLPILIGFDNNLHNDPILNSLVLCLIGTLHFTATVLIPYLKNKNDAEIAKYTLEQSVLFIIAGAAILILIIVLHLINTHLWQNVPLEAIYM